MPEAFEKPANAVDIPLQVPLSDGTVEEIGRIRVMPGPTGYIFVTGVDNPDGKTMEMIFQNAEAFGLVFRLETTPNG